MSRICVFCGSSSGASPTYSEAAVELGRALVARSVDLVYGGASVGLMGVLADAVLENGGKVYGVIPQSLVDRELAHSGLTELRVVQSMHERKALMADLADGFIALPGGFGTLDEFCEVLTWAQLRIHRKNCGLLNVGGYYDSLLALFDRAAEQGFLSASNRQLVISNSDPERLVDAILAAPAQVKPKWMSVTRR